jgi:hypothetical protein
LGTAEDPIKVIHHSVLLTGLEIGETYVYRVVSRASPPTVGFQYSFILTENGIVATGPGGILGGGSGGSGGQGGDSSGVLPPGGDGGSTGGVGGSGDGSGGNNSTSSGGSGTGGDSGGNNSTSSGGSGTGGDSVGSGDGGSTTTPTTNSQVATAGLLDFPDSFLGWLECFGLLMLFIVIIYIAWILWRKNNDNHPIKGLSNYRNIFFFVGSLISILIAYLLGWICTITPLIIVAIVSLILYLWNLFKK